MLAFNACLLVIAGGEIHNMLFLRRVSSAAFRCVFPGVQSVLGGGGVAEGGGLRGGAGGSHVRVPHSIFFCVPLLCSVSTLVCPAYSSAVVEGLGYERATRSTLSCAPLFRIRIMWQYLHFPFFPERLQLFIVNEV